VTRKPRVVTFRLDQATWDWMRELVPYTKYKNTSSFIREGIDLLLRQEDEEQYATERSLFFSGRAGAMKLIAKGAINTGE
jgi:Arc/MetJ-type ribon-helix-helix transcriptional regulator